MSGTTSLVAVAAAVTTVIVGVSSLVPGAGNGSAEAVVMAPTGTGVLRGIGTGEPMPYVAPQPYEPEAPRQVAGPQPLLFPTADPSALALPDPLLSTPGSKVIPARVLAAYQAAARAMAKDRPSCHLTWPILAGIGRIESGHARGGDVDAAGTTLTPIVGPALTGEGNFALIRDSDDGRWDGDTVYDRAVGPMQFLPGTWAGSGRDGNGDGDANPNNVADAALASAGYLCAGGANLLDRDDLLAAVFRYNRSWEYVSHVLAWAGVYARTAPLGGDDKAKKKGKATTSPSPSPKPNPVASVPPTAPTPPVAPAPTPPVPPDPTDSPTPTPTLTPTPTHAPSPEPSEPTLGALGGRVFQDLDADGVEDPEDTGVEGAGVRLTGTTAAGEAVDLTAPTDTEGRFAFVDLAPGTYALRLAELPGGLLPLGVLAPVGEILGLDGVEAVEVTAGDTVLIGFVAGPLV